MLQGKIIIFNATLGLMLTNKVFLFRDEYNADAQSYVTNRYMPIVYLYTDCPFIVFPVYALSVFMYNNICHI